jgi:hypothetical protein
MHARMITCKVKPDCVDAVKELIEQAVTPVAREQPGYRGSIGLVDRGTGQAIFLTFWETSADLERTEIGSYLPGQIARVAHLLDGPTVSETFEVAHSAGPDGGRSGAPPQDWLAQSLDAP